MSIVTFDGHTPVVHRDAWIASTATVIGQAEIAADASVFYGAVVRADKTTISLGARSNLQDNVVVHADIGHPALLGTDVTVGHGAILHGCTIEDGCLIGMGAIIMNGAVIGAGSLVAAGALVLEGQQIPPGSLVAGSPGRVRRPLTAAESAVFLTSAADYVEVSKKHRDAGG